MMSTSAIQQLVSLLPSRLSPLLLVLVVGVSTRSAEGQVFGKAHKEVIDLNAHNFKAFLDDSANGLWLLKFYAPWCGHCKRMAPVLDAVAPQVSGRMAIGKIDCTVQKSLCREHGVTGYPTLKVSRDGHISDYPGGRSERDILFFARKMNQGAVESSCKFETEGDIVFVGHHPDMEGETLTQRLQSQPLLQKFFQTARTQQAFANFCLLNDNDANTEGWKQSLGLAETSSFPTGFVARYEPGVTGTKAPAILWDSSSADTDEDDITATTASIIQFVKLYNYPTVSDLGPSNFHKIGHLGKPLVIGCIDGKDSTMKQKMKQELLDYTIQSRSSNDNDHDEKYIYGVLNAKQFHQFLSQFRVSSDALPQYLVLHVPTKTFWQNETYTDLAAFLRDVNNGVLESSEQARAGGWKGFVHQAEFMFFKYLPWSLVAVIALCAVVVILILPPPDDLRPPYNNEDGVIGDGEYMEEQDDGEGEQHEEPAADNESKKDK